MVTEVGSELPHIASADVQPNWVLTHVNGTKLHKHWPKAVTQLRHAVGRLPHKSAKAHRHSPHSRRNTVDSSPKVSEKIVAMDLLGKVPKSVDLSLWSYEGALVR